MVDLDEFTALGCFIRSLTFFNSINFVDVARSSAQLFFFFSILVASCSSVLGLDLVLIDAKEA